METPPAVKDLLARCLEKDVRQRLRDIGEARIALAGDLSAHATGRGTPAGAEVVTAERPGWQRLFPWALVAVLAVAALTALWRPWQMTPPAPTPIRVSAKISGDEPLFMLAGAAAVLSPDGRRLAYVSVGETERQLHVRSLDQLESTPLSGTAGASNPFFSPDGQWVAFFAGRQAQEGVRSGGRAAGARSCLSQSWRHLGARRNDRTRDVW